MRRVPEQRNCENGRRGTRDCKNVVPGQKVSASINKVRKGKCEGRLLEVLERSAKEQPEAACIHAGECGGCIYQTLPYAEQLAMKASQVKKLIDDVIVPENTDYEFLWNQGEPETAGVPE